MDRLKAMQSFVRVMRSGNFSTAARQLGVSRALISRHIIALERHLGFSLLSRSTRNVVPTEAARTYLAFCERVLRELEREQEFGHYREKAASAVKIVGPKSFGTLKLADAILALTEAEPQLRTSLSLEDFSFRPNEFMEKGYDIAICISSINDSTLISRRIATLDWILCAAPGYIRRHGRPQNPHDLKHHACLAHLNLEPNDRVWRFENEGKRVSVKIDGPFQSNSAVLLREAALRGLGIAVLPRYAVSGDIASGALVPLLRRHRLPSRPLASVYPRSLAGSAKVKTVNAWLIRWFKEHDPNSSHA
jgi:DNA-binding transcriptional LysR family regulator